MAKILTPEWRINGKSFPIEVNGTRVVFYCDFQWSSASYLCQPFGLVGNTLKKGNCVYNLKYVINGGGNKYLEFPSYNFSLGMLSYTGKPSCFMFPRYRRGAAVVCARLKTEQYLTENDSVISKAYRIADNSGANLKLVEVPFSQFDYPYKFDTLPTADDGTFWGLKYDKAFYGGIKLIA